MIGSVRAELLRLLRWPVTWVLAGLWLTLSLSFGYLFPYLRYREAAPVLAPALLEQLMPAQVPTTLLRGLPMFGGAIMLVLAALAVGSGYAWGTWKTAFTAGPRRGAVVGGTLLALGLIVTGLMLLTAVLEFAAATVLASTLGQPVTLPGLADTAAGLGAALLIAGMWTAAGALLGTLTRGPALSVGLGLIWALVAENLLRGVAGLLGPFQEVIKVLPGSAVGSLAGSFGANSGVPGVLTLLDGTPAALVSGGYLVLFLAGSIALTARRDLA